MALNCLNNVVNIMFLLQVFQMNPVRMAKLMVLKLVYRILGAALLILIMMPCMIHLNLMTEHKVSVTP